MTTEVKVLTSEAKFYKVEMENETPLEAIDRKVLKKTNERNKIRKR